MNCIGWEDWWDYEPIDLAGYIPDFVITPPSAPQFILEVKPALTWEELESHPDLVKIQQSGWKGEVLVVGTQPIWYTDCGDAIGLLAERVEDQFAWGPALCMFCENMDGGGFRYSAMDFCHGTHGYNHRCCGSYDGNSCVLDRSDMPWRAWKAAGNTTRWKPYADNR